MKYCLRCGKEHEDVTWIACVCGLEVEVRTGYLPMTRYHNIFDSRWYYVPDGCLLIVNGEEL